MILTPETDATFQLSYVGFGQVNFNDSLPVNGSFASLGY